DGRIVFVQEGGYSLDSLASGVHAVLSTLAGRDPKPIVECGMPEVEEAIDFHRDAWADDADAT
ncbi:MAG: histone deacetylase, partial [Planctomycetota bacterium]